jgi:hypothetical protein
MHRRTGISIILALFVVTGLRAAEVGVPDLPEAKYTGAGSCGSPSCHGGIKPRTETSVLQNEYSTWVVRDKHTKAFNVLTGEVGLRMGKILGIEHPEQAAKCLVCHALNVPLELRARSFDANDGVSCENCHGAASNWLGPHTTRDWNYAKSVKIGLYDTRDLIKRSERCLSCHLGDSEKFVDHQMIAAGHPDLYFELDSFEAVQPRHWTVPVDKDPWIGVRTLATGQAVQLREGMRRLARRSQGTIWPEYGELDCFACHHSLTLPKDSWRQARGYIGRPPGNPPFNASRYAVLQTVVGEIDPDSWRQLESDLTEVYKLVSDISSDRTKVSAVALRAADKADRLARQVVVAPFDRAATLRLLKKICADSDRIAGQGERSAEQAAMSLDSLLIAYSMNDKPANQDQLRGAINQLFAQLDTPSAYNPNNFSRQMRAVGALLP